MDEGKHKEGISVKELEGYAKKHRFELLFILFFLFASLFTFVFWGSMISIFLCGIGAMIAVFMTGKVEHASKKMLEFVFKQEKTIQLILGIFGLVLAIFVAPLVFFILGLHGGKSLVHQAKEANAHEHR